MKTIEITLYKFDELTKNAQDVAIEIWRNEGVEDVWASERIESWKIAGSFYKQLHEIQEEISGARLYTWIQNNLAVYWTERNFISKHLDGTFKNSYFQYKYDCLKYRKSKIFSTNTLENCPLTGVCYDFDFLKPIIDFIKTPSAYTSNTDLKLPDYNEITEKEMDYQNSDEAIKETIESNDYDFLSNGSRY